jgi:hypothetical protein
MKVELLSLLSEKPEMVTSLPEWMLPPETERIFRNSHDTAIAEIAGRDSIAAVIKACSTHSIKRILPTIAYTGTEYGSWDTPLRAVEILKQTPQISDVVIEDPVFIGSPDFWWKLCGRPASTMLEQFGFTTPCIGCHLYFHAVRVPLAKKLDCHSIIAGERESHDGRIKINQVGTALDLYSELCWNWGIELLLPIRNILSGKEVEQLLQTPWEEGEKQLQCVLSENYRDREGKVTFDNSSISKYLRDLAMPIASDFIQSHISR